MRYVALWIVFLTASVLSAQYTVDVQVVDLQVSVSDKQGNFVNDLKPDDFQVWEDGQPQEILDLELNREPFSVGVLLDTSSSMQPNFRMTLQTANDFISSLHPEDEFFVMTFDDRIEIRKDFTPASTRANLSSRDLHYGDGTRLFDGVVEAVQHLSKAVYPRRALFVISDGMNTRGGGNLKQALELAQKNKVLIYSLMLDHTDNDWMTLSKLSEETGGSYFILYGGFPRFQAAYDKIATDLAHRFTLYYRSHSDYSKARKPEITVRTKYPNWRVRYQKAYFPLP